MDFLKRKLVLLALLSGAASSACHSTRPTGDGAGGNAQTQAQGGPDGSAQAPAKESAAPAKHHAAATHASESSAKEPAAPRAPDADVAVVAREPKKTLTPAETRAALEADNKAFAAPLELVETSPVETTLDHADVREAKDVWPSMFNRASAKIDLEEFYLSDEPGSALGASLLALEAAAARGVQVRLLADSKMAETYPETIKRLAAEKNVQTEIIDYHQLAGGVQHAKFFVVDGAEAYEGSQNFDWRSLSEIQEMGLRFRAPEAVRALEDVFETDWALAGGAAKTTRVAPKSAYRFPTPAGAANGSSEAKSEATLTFVASPKGWLPDESTWDLPQMVHLIDGAKSSVKVQVLTYRAHSKRENFPELDDALKRAAARGVQVTLLVSHWSLRKGTVEGLQELAAWRPGAEPGSAGGPGGRSRCAS